MGATWFDVLMLLRPLHPGPAVEPGTTLDCRGCGRRIPIDGMRLKEKFRCSRCGRVNRITEKNLAFRHTKEEEEKKKAGTRLAGMTIFGLCLLAVAPMAGKAGDSLLRMDTFAAFGMGAVWMALLLNLVCYGVGVGVGVALIWLLAVVRRHTQEIGIIGAVMTIFGGFGRMLFYWLGEQMNSPFTPSLPYGLVVWGSLSTVGSLWRASLFEKR